MREFGSRINANPVVGNNKIPHPGRFKRSVGEFVKRDNAFYAPIKDAGLATGKLTPPRR